jgi:hypothetical protein
MSNNDLSGFLPSYLKNLTSLQQLNLSYNNLKIPMSLSPLYNHSKLKYFNALGNEIYAEEDDHNLSPKFQLESLYLSSRGQCVGAFPKFLYHQVNLQYMDLRNIQINGEFPKWLIENNTYLEHLYLENCSLSGPFLLPKNSHKNLSILSISMNYFLGQIPLEIGAYLPGLVVLLMSDNRSLFAGARRRGEYSTLKSRKCVNYLSGKCGETRKYCLWLVEKWNGSRHLVFWSLETLTGLRDWVRGLVA